MSEYLGNIFMTAVSFPYTLQIQNLAPFILFYNIKGMSLIYSLSNFGSLISAGLAVLFISFQLYNLVDRFGLLFMSFNGLLAFEYFLTLFLFVKHMFLNYFKDVSPIVEFTINSIYLLCRIFVTGFYANNLAKFRMPITYLKMLAIDLSELRKISVVFLKYIKVCRELKTIEDVEVSGEDCAICTDEITKGKKLGCNHIFHTDCLKMWCERESTCPICRKPLTFTKEVTIETDTEIIRAQVL